MLRLNKVKAAANNTSSAVAETVSEGSLESRRRTAAENRIQKGTIELI